MHTKKTKAKLRRFLLTKEVVMLLLVSVSFGLLVMEHLGQLTRLQLHYLEIFEIVLGIILLIEFFFEYYHAKDRKKYFKHNWFYLLAAIPIPTQTFEILHEIRLLRLLKVLRIFGEYRYDLNTRLFQR